MRVKKQAHVKMLLFAFGFKRVSMEKSFASGDEKCNLIVPNHMPTAEEACGLGLGRVEYASVINSVGEVSDPIPSKKQKVVRGKYAVYSAEDQARIGKYALESGNEKARVHFLKKFPNLRESTVRNFKKAYKEKLTQESKKLNPQPITRIVTQPKGGH